MPRRINLFLPFFFFSLFVFSQQTEKKERDTSFYQRSEKFYDSVYRKFNRHRFTKLLYNLAFVAPKVSDLPDSVQVEKSENPFNLYNGKIIRRISIKTLGPFGPTIYDTAEVARTSAGKALNAVHMNTRKHVIRKNLLIHPGETIKPEILADNERILRNLSAIDNARIIVTEQYPGSDSVDIMVVTKDVWSIGVEIPTITTSKIQFRLYDANFLGLDDNLSTKFSVETKRAPFLRFDGFSYTYRNIGGSFIDCSLDYSFDDEGNQGIKGTFTRSFLTNYTKWAGGLSIGFWKNIISLNDTLEAVTYFNDQNAWAGWSVTPVAPPAFTRFIITGGAYRRQFTSRPFVSIDSNRAFYNHLQLLTGFAISRNNYYLIDYLSAFGKTETLPYGYLIQATLGEEFTDFYQRFYCGIKFSAGDYFEKIGYFQASVRLGSFIDHDNFEDAVLKVSTLYFTPLKTFKRSHLKLRSFFLTDYRNGFNLRDNNKDYFDLNNKLNINKVKDSDVLVGTQIFSAKLSLIIYTPWYFYGFRFAILGQLAGGLCSAYKQPLFKSRFIFGIGTGVIIKNDNLVFPNFMIAGYFYPTTPGGINMFQGVLSSTPVDRLSDFNVGSPQMETLGN